MCFLVFTPGGRSLTSSGSSPGNLRRHNAALLQRTSDFIHASVSTFCQLVRSRSRAPFIFSTFFVSVCVCLCLTAALPPPPRVLALLRQSGKTQLLPLMNELTVWQEKQTTSSRTSLLEPPLSAHQHRCFSRPGSAWQQISEQHRHKVKTKNSFLCYEHKHFMKK